MFCGTAAGELPVLPPYAIYKAENLWRTWCEGGPNGMRFGRSKSGWMDAQNFEEWFMTIVVPWARKKEGRKVIIGDNLSSHISTSVLDKCQELNIGFVLLPPNTTDKCQPLDVSFFAPLKKEWRKLLDSYRQKYPKSKSLDKSLFPSMVNNLIEALGMRSFANLISGFQGCGIVPLDSQGVLRKFPQQRQDDPDKGHAGVISDAVLQYLHQFKYSPGSDNSGSKKKRTKVSVPASKSLSADDLKSKALSSKPGPSSSEQGPSSSEPDPSSSTTAHHSLGKRKLPMKLLAQQKESDATSDSDTSQYSDFSLSEDEEWLPAPKKSKKHLNF